LVPTASAKPAVRGPAWSGGPQVTEQRAYAALVEDYKRVVDEVGNAEVTLRWLHGCGSLWPT